MCRPTNPVPPRTKTSRRAVLLQQFHKVTAPMPGRPRQRHRPRLVAGQIRPRSTLEQELDHPPSALRLFGALHCATGANGRGQGRPLEFDFPGVDVGAGVQKKCRHGPIAVLGAGVQKRLAEPVRTVRIQSATEQSLDKSGDLG